MNYNQRVRQMHVCMHERFFAIDFKVSVGSIGCTNIGESVSGSLKKIGAEGYQCTHVYT